MSAVLAAGALVPEAMHVQPAEAEESSSEDQVLPVEDLMREHGVLRRVLLVYEEVSQRLSNKQDVSPELLTRSADVIRNFVEDYHEKLEEKYVFPLFAQLGRQEDLVRVLAEQHAAGRSLTSRIRQLSVTSGFTRAEDRHQVISLIALFTRMYRPHAAREDTVLFPQFRSMLKPGEYAALGDVFEGRENRLFGEGGFDSVVYEVADIEQLLGIHDISLFTPD